MWYNNLSVKWDMSIKLNQSCEKSTTTRYKKEKSTLMYVTNGAFFFPANMGRS